MSKRSPWVFVPTLYFAQGLPYTVVMMMSAVYFKDLGADNVLIGLSSALNLPWIWKFAWAPLIDFFGYKKRWIVVAQAVLTVLFILLSFAALSHDPVTLTIWIFAFMAVVSATHDASIDGYYLEILDKTEQALFVGVRNTAYRLAMLFSTGAMVMLAGYLTKNMGKHQAWMLAFVVLSALMGAVFLFHSWFLPIKRVSDGKTSTDGQLTGSEKSSLSTESSISHESSVAGESSLAGENSLAGESSLLGESTASHENITTDETKTPTPSSSTEAQQTPATHPDRNYFRAILSYFQQPGIVAIVFYILLFRLGDALVMKMIPSFLKDPAAKAGLGLSTVDIGIIYGTVGIFFLLLGGIVGGYIVSKGGLKRWLWPTTLFMNGAILLYWLLALLHPDPIWVYVVNSIEQFGYGIGMAAYTVFVLTTVKQEYKAAHYAVATAMQATGVMLPGMASGYILDGFTITADNLKHIGLSNLVGAGQLHSIPTVPGSDIVYHFAGLGYTNFFLVSFLLSFPGIISIFYLPIWRKEPTTAAS